MNPQQHTESSSEPVPTNETPQPTSDHAPQEAPAASPGPEPAPEGDSADMDAVAARVESGLATDVASESEEPTEPMPAQVNAGAAAPAASENAPQAAADAVDDQVQKELDAAMGDLEAAGLTGEAPKDTPPPPAPAKKAGIRGPRVVQAGREHRKGVVVSVGPNDVFIEFGPKELGVVERIAWKDDEALPAVGEEIELVVTRYDKNENIFICSRPGAVQKADWELLEPGQVVEARVTGVNKGGLELEIANHRAFMPAGQVDVRRIDDLSVFVGEKLECKIMRVDRGGRGNIVLSRRDMLAAEREKLAAELRESLAEGQEVDGLVKKIMPFGAFVDIGGIDGLIHVADLSHERVNLGEKNIERYVKEGQQVRVQVLKLDWDANRISLGLKQLQDDPFVVATEELTEEAIVTGKVKNIADFGAFVELPGGLEGLVHISELAWSRTNHPSEVVQPDQVVQVKVLKIDPDTRRIALSIKQAEERPKREGDDQKGRGGPGGRGGGGRGRGGRGERDDRSAEEILKETPQLRRMREKAKNASGATGGLKRRSLDPLAQQVAIQDDADNAAEKKQKEPAKKRKQEDLPSVDGLDQLLNKFGGL